MEIIPAIDLLDGHVVRLHQGDYAKVTRFPIDPVAHARALSGRVVRMHVVDLAAAKSGEPTAEPVLAKMAEAFGPGLQVGGGVRDRARAERLFSMGISRVVLGTAALRDPEMTAALAHAHPGKVILGVDARDGWVAVDGWTTTSKVRAAELAARFSNAPIDALLFTDVARDGTGVGPAVASTGALAAETGRRVIASGGVGSLDDLRALAALDGVLGAIVGRALLDGSFTLDEAIAAARGGA
jgi:phosphoribosylformimino-5-aminoimidazole carboxamide ribotide isomerase